MRARPIRFLLLAPLAACKGCDQAIEAPVDLTEIPATPVGLTVGDGVGSGGVARVAAFATSEVGAAVKADDINLDAGDALLDSPSLVTDAGGWGVVTVNPPPGGGAWVATVTASMGGANASGTALIGTRAAPGWGAAGSAAHGTPSLAAVAGNGLVWSAGNEAWWATPGSPAVRVLALPDDLRGLQAVEADDDGVTDLVAWSSTEVVLLRGRDEGGLVHGAAWRAAAGRVVGAFVGDIGGDGEQDVAITLDRDDGGSRVVVLEGDGVWRYAVTEGIDVTTDAVSMTMEDLDGDGALELTLLDGDGVLRRYARFGDTWSPTTTSAVYDLQLGPAGRLHPSQDCDGDGIADIVASGPLKDGSGHQAWVVTLGDADPTMFRAYNGEGDREEPEWMGIAVGDVTGDGLGDLVLSAPRAITRASWDLTDPASPALRLFELSAVPEGPLATGDMDADGVPELVVATDGGVIVLPAERIEDVPGTTEDEGVAWRIAAPDSRRLDTALVGPARAGDATGDGVADVVGYVRIASGLALQVWSGVRSAGGANDEALRANSPALQGASSEPLDLAVCGARVFALTQEVDGSTLLRRWAVTSAGALAPQGGPFAVTGATAVACGAFPGAEAAILQSTGAVTYLATNGTLTAGPSQAGGVDLAAADLNGDGVDEPATCATEGCVVVATDLDGDGIDEIVTGEGGLVTVSFADESVLLDASGVPSVGDADGDGLRDLLVGELGRVTVLRAGIGGPGPEEVRHAGRDALGEVLVGDLSGDGAPDAFWFGATDGALDGALVYARSVRD